MPTYPSATDLLIFVGIPLAVIVIVAVLVFAGGRGGVKRYRPGRNFEAKPVWFLARPEAGEPQPESGPAAQLTPAGTPESAGLTGGASDRW